MGVGSGEAGGRGPPWIFIHGTNIADGGLKVLFFGIFPVGPPLKNFLPTTLGKAVIFLESISFFLSNSFIILRRSCLLKLSFLTFTNCLSFSKILCSNSKSFL